MTEVQSKKTSGPISLLGALGAIAFVGFVLYQAYGNFFTYTDDTLTRHDRQMLGRAEDGDAEAQVWMGRFLITGRQGLEPDPAAARRWFEKATAQGSAAAAFELGTLYRRGSGVERDLAEAARLFTEAEGKGDLAARNALGELTLRGEGVEESAERARELFELAAEKAFAPAQRNLGYLAASGKGMAQDYAVAMAWYRKAAEQADGIAMSNLGLMHEHGQGVEADPVRAWDCYYHAALFGFAGASKHLERIETKIPAEWLARGLYEREGRDCLTGEPSWISRPRSRVRE